MWTLEIGSLEMAGRHRDETPGWVVLRSWGAGLWGESWDSWPLASVLLADGRAGAMDAMTGQDGC